MQAEPGLRIIVVLPREIAFGRQYGGWAKQGYDARLEAVHALQAVDPARVVAYHPFGFPGRSLNVRTTVAIVDDVWCLVGTSAIRRRGLTFDGATDVVSFDRRIAGGYSSGVATFRRAL